MTTNVSKVADSDGVRHSIVGQSKKDLCVPTSIYMMQRILQKRPMDGNNSQIELISARFDGSMLMNAIMGGGGTSQANIKDVFAAIGITITHTQDSFRPPASSIPLTVTTSRIRQGSPALLWISWVRTNAIVGAHAVVAVRVSKRGFLVVLDPWAGTRVQVGGTLTEAPNSGTYRPTYGGDGRITFIAYTG